MFLAVINSLSIIQARHAVPLQGNIPGLNAGYTGMEACATNIHKFKTRKGAEL
jgi:hypothetical protein